MLTLVDDDAALAQGSAIATLTDYEWAALSGRHNLADGHAYHLLSEVLPTVAPDLTEIWVECDRTPVPEMEQRYVRALSALAGAPALTQLNCRIAPTASNAIDIVGAFLAERGLRTALIEPTFDNLALMLRRRGVQLTAVPEMTVHLAAEEGLLSACLDSRDFDALFLVDPNNPTGRELNAVTLRAIADYCATSGKLLIIDRSFRFYGRGGFDDYQLLQDSGVEHIVIEDTGKVWPTHDLKASALAYSKGPAADIEAVFGEIYLCHSRFALGILERCLKETLRLGLEQVIWRPVAARREQLRECLRASSLIVDAGAETSHLSVEWLDCRATGRSDLDLTTFLQAHGVMVLPGRQFYWASPEKPINQHNIRVAMMKPARAFEASARRIAELCPIGQVDSCVQP